MDKEHLAAIAREHSIALAHTQADSWLCTCAVVFVLFVYLAHRRTRPILSHAAASVFLAAGSLWLPVYQDPGYTMPHQILAFLVAAILIWFLVKPYTRYVGRHIQETRGELEKLRNTCNRH